MKRDPDLGHSLPSGPDQLMTAWDHLLYTLGAPPDHDDHHVDSTDGTSAAEIPVTILSGFLGAGKTTLLCRMLADTPLKILAIVNDMATVNIDAALIRSTNAETMQLENGCACCVLGSDLNRALRDIGQRSEKPDAIVIEASGISDPIGIAQTVAQNPSTFLDGIVTVVDATTLPARLADPLSAPLLERQLNAAHLIALSKTCNNDNLKALQDLIGERVPGRQVLRLDQAGVNAAEIILGASMRGARPAPETAPHAYGEFCSTVISFNGAVEAHPFFLLLETIPESVYRIKGWLTLQDGDRVDRHEIQAVGRHWRAVRMSVSSEPDQLVVIGRNGSGSFNRFCQALSALPATLLQAGTGHNPGD